MKKIEIKGQCQNKFNKIKDILYDEIMCEHSVGSAFAVYQDGNALVDLYGGYTDKNKSREWNRDTIVPVHSVGKGIVSLCLILLISRNELSLDSKVSEYWPKFGNNGKVNIRLRTLMSHQAGLYGWRDKLSQEDLYNWDYCVNLLAEQRPFHKPGEETCYHAKTIGFLSGEIIKRITNKTVGEFINDEFVKNNFLSCFIGTPNKYHSTISEVFSSINYNNDKNKNKSEDKYIKYGFNNPPTNRSLYSDKKWIEAEIPSLNCYANASSLAQIYDLFINSNSCSILNSNSLDEALMIESNRMDYIMRLPIKWSPVGLIIGGGKLFGNSERAFGHTGSGGSIAFADPDQKLSISYTTNTLSKSLIDDRRALNLVSKLYKLI